MRRTPAFLRSLQRLARPFGPAVPRTLTDGERIERMLGIATMAFGLVAIAVFTLRPGWQRESPPFWCFRCSDQPLVDAVLNAALFVPLGIGLGLQRASFRRAAVVAALCSLTVEFLQFAAVPGRDASARDLVANTLGGIAAWLVASEWRTLLVPRATVSRRVALGASALWLASQAFTAWAMHSSLPDTEWWARLRPPYDNDARFKTSFAGTLDSVVVGTVAMPHSDEMAEADEARRSMTAGEPLRAVVRDVPPTRGQAPIVVVTAGPVLDVASLVQDGRDLIFETTVRGTRLGLRTPAIRLTEAVPQGRSAQPTVLEGSYVGGQYRLRAVHEGVVRQRVLDASASMGWAFLVRAPGYAIGGEFRLLTALWLAAVWTALGYWYGRALRGATRRTGRWVTLALLGTTVLAGLVLIPILAGLPASRVAEWAGAAVGVAAGWLVARRVAPAPVPVARVAWVAPERVGRALRRR